MLRRVAALNPHTQQLEDKEVQWFKTDFSRHVVLANEDCELGDATNPWAFALLRFWLKAVFVPVNRRFSVLQSVLHSCNLRLNAYIKAHPQLVVDETDDPCLKVIRGSHDRGATGGSTSEGMRLPRTSGDASRLLLSRPNSFEPAIDILRGKTYTIFMDVPGLTHADIKLSRQNVTTIIKGGRSPPYDELQVRVERSERKVGDFTTTFRIPQEYERRWAECSVVNGVLKMSFNPDTDEESFPLLKSAGGSTATTETAMDPS